MHTQPYKRFLFLAFLNIVLVWNISGVEPSIEINKNIILSPETRTIRIGEVPEIILTSRAVGHNLKFQWTIDGLGRPKDGETTQPVMVYIPPEKLPEKTSNGDTAEVTITVKVIDENQEEATDSITLTLLAPKAEIRQMAPTPTPFPTNIRKVFLKEREGTFIAPTYEVPRNGFIIITPDIVNPSNRDIKIEAVAVFGKVEDWEQGKLIYSAPSEKDGSDDIVTLKLVDQETNEIVAEEVINIKCRPALRIILENDG
jgi:hypothetical protein